MNFAGALKTTLWVLVAFALTWTLAFFYWRSAGRVPGALELGLVLVAVPLALVTTGALVARRAAPASAQSPAASADATPAPPPPPPRARTIIAGSLALPSGSDPAAILAAPREPTAPGLHASLRDRRGLPVFACGDDALDVESLQRELEAQPGAGARYEPEFVRALALAMPVVEALAGHAASIPATDPSSPIAVEEALLIVNLLLPERWRAEERELAQQLIGRRLHTLALGRHQLVIHAVTSGAEAMRRVAATPPTGEAPPESQRRELWLALDSRLGQRSVGALENGPGLLAAGNAEGICPGEGAAGLVLGDALTGGTGSRLRVLEYLRLEDAAARPPAQAAQLQALITTALQRSGADAAEVDLLLSDADHRPSRSLPLARASAATLSGLEPGEDSLQLGQACGDAGAVLALAALALAATHCEEGGKTALVASLHHARDRAVALVSPAPAAAKASADAA